MTSWRLYDEGGSIGARGSEEGRIVSDEEHPGGARITLEEGGMTAPWSVTCGVYGWMVHTRFFARKDDAAAEIVPMKADIEEILAEACRITGEDDNAGYRRVTKLCSAFVERFP